VYAYLPWHGSQILRIHNDLLSQEGVKPIGAWS
jgi:hypothetical protein